MTDLKLAAQKALAQRLQQFRHAHYTHWSVEENQLIVDCFHALQHQEEREPAFDAMCAECGHTWGDHHGELCPVLPRRFRAAAIATRQGEKQTDLQEPGQ